MIVLISLYTVNKNTNLDWLEQSLVAINAQTYKNFNYLFLDYGSDNIYAVHKLVTSKLKDINYEFKTISPVVVTKADIILPAREVPMA